MWGNHLNYSWCDELRGTDTFNINYRPGVNNYSWDVSKRFNYHGSYVTYGNGGGGGYLPELSWAVR